MTGETVAMVVGATVAVAGTGCTGGTDAAGTAVAPNEESIIKISKSR